MSRLNFAALVVIAAISGAASAQSSGSRGACKADYDKFCAGIAPGGGKVIACLNAKHDQLSASCKTALDGRKK